MSSEQAERLLDEIRALPRGERLRLVERVVHELANEDAEAPPAAVIALFADEADLLESVCEEAMQARERDALRLRGG